MKSNPKKHNYYLDGLIMSVTSLIFTNGLRFVETRELFAGILTGIAVIILGALWVYYSVNGSFWRGLGLIILVWGLVGVLYGLVTLNQGNTPLKLGLTLISFGVIYFAYRLIRK